MNKMETKNLKKLSNSRGTVIRINVFTIIATILSFIAFIPIAIITAYFIFSSLGKEELLLGLFESWNMQGFSNFFIDKINASSQKDIYFLYLLFAVLSFTITLIISIKTFVRRIKSKFRKRRRTIDLHKGNGILFVIHLLSTAAIIAYYLYLHRFIIKDTTNINEILTIVWTIITPFMIIIVPFLFWYWTSIRNKNNIKAREAQGYINLLLKKKRPVLDLYSSYGLHFLALTIQIYVLVFCTDATLTVFLNLFIEVIKDLAATNVFASQVLKLDSAFYKKLNEDLRAVIGTQQDTLAIIKKSLEEEISHSDYLEETVDSKNEVINAQQEYIYALEDELYSYTQK